MDLERAAGYTVLTLPGRFWCRCARVIVCEVAEARVLSVTTSPELGGQALREAESQFGAAALSAVNQWKFQPGVTAGEPVDTQMQRPVSFILTEKVK